MMRTTAGGLLTALSIALLGAVAPASAAHAAELQALDVEVVSANGSGCPSATANAQAVDDASFTVNSESFYAWSGVEAPATAVRRNCQFAIQITQPEGWTYAVQGADFNGYAQLADGINGQQRVSYYFQAQSQTVTGSHTLTGPFNGGWDSSDSFETDALVFAPCGAQRLLNINSEVRVTSADTDVNWVYLNPSFTVHLAWQPC